jgi:hypothetical protein
MRARERRGQSLQDIKRPARSRQRNPPRDRDTDVGRAQSSPLLQSKRELFDNGFPAARCAKSSYLIIDLSRVDIIMERFNRWLTVTTEPLLRMGGGGI